MLACMSERGREASERNRGNSWCEEEVSASKMTPPIDFETKKKIGFEIYFLVLLFSLKLLDRVNSESVASKKIKPLLKNKNPFLCLLSYS